MNKYYVLVVMAISLFSVTVGSSFIEKKKKTPSIRVLKEECCELFGELLSCSSDMLTALGTVQKKALSIIEGCIKSDDTWCKQASGEKLLTCNKRIALLTKKLEQACEESLLLLVELQTLHDATPV